MKREFLQNFKVGDQPLTKEIIDAILDENSRDIGAAKAEHADYDTIKTQLSEAQKTIKGFQDQGADIEAVRKSAKEWEDKYNQAIADHKKEMEDLALDGLLKDAIQTAKGRNDKAIRALLEVDTLKFSKNQTEDIKAALENLKKENGYLFEGDSQVPPPFNPGTGVNPPAPKGDFNFGFTGIRAHGAEK